MQNGLLFDRFALIITRPTNWDKAHTIRAQGLGAFLRLLLSTKGFCRLGEVPSESQNVRWLTNNEAIDWVSATEESHKKMSRVWKQLNWSKRFGLCVQRRCRIFFDYVCFLDALTHALEPMKWQDNAFNPDIEAIRHSLSIKNVKLAELQTVAKDHISSGGALYFSFELDFSEIDQQVIFTPQLAIWGFWPEDSNYAPAPKKEVLSRNRMNVEQVTSILDELFWGKIEVAFSALRAGFQLAHSELEVSSMRIQHPSFYFVSPCLNRIPNNPEEYFEQSWLPTLSHLVQTHLGTEDPLSFDLSGALSEGKLLVLRRELIIREFGRIIPNYLILPSRPNLTTVHSLEERTLLYLADKLSFLELSISQQACSLHQDLSPWKKTISLWLATTKAFARIFSIQSQALDYSPNRIKKLLYEQINNLHQRLLNMGSELMRKTSDVLYLPRKLESHITDLSMFIRNNMTMRKLSLLKTIIESLADTYVFSSLKEPINASEKAAYQLRETYQGVKESLESVLEQEKRELAEKRSDNINRFTIVIAILTAIIVLTSMVDIKLSQSVIFNSWQYSLLIKPYLEKYCAYIIVIAIAMAVLILVKKIVIAVIKIWSNIHPPVFYRISKKIARLGQIIEIGNEGVLRLAWITKNVGTQGSDILELQKQIEKLDTKASNELITILTKLEELRNFRIAKQSIRSKTTIFAKITSKIRKTKFSSTKIIPSSRMRDADTNKPFSKRRIKDLKQWSEEAILASLLVDERPFPTSLPRTLALFRYKVLNSFSDEPIVENEEVNLVLTSIGYDKEAVDSIMAWCEQEGRWLSSTKFINKLLEMGVGTVDLGTPQQA